MEIRLFATSMVLSWIYSPRIPFLSPFCSEGVTHLSINFHMLPIVGIILKPLFSLMYHIREYNVIIYWKKYGTIDASLYKVVFQITGREINGLFVLLAFYFAWCVGGYEYSDLTNTTAGSGIGGRVTNICAPCVAPAPRSPLHLPTTRMFSTITKLTL